MNIKRNEHGSALLISIFVLLILTLLGISGTNLTNLEITVSRNDKFTKLNDYEADAGGEISKQMIESGIDQRIWLNVGEGTPALISMSNVRIPDNSDTPTGKANKNFFLDLVIDDESLEISDDEASGVANIDREDRIDTYQDSDYVNAYIDKNDNDNLDNNETRLYVFTGETLSEGGAIQMAAGYEGVGKGSAGAGAYRPYQLRSRHEGVDNSVGMVLNQWVHVY